MSKFDYEAAERGPWQPAGTKPPVPGVYERIYNRGTKAECVLFCKFNRVWYCAANTPKEAGAEHRPTIFRHFEWRGLLRKPE